MASVTNGEGTGTYGMHLDIPYKRKGFCDDNYCLLGRIEVLHAHDTRQDVLNCGE